jgi:class 3 adenylate cyclase
MKLINSCAKALSESMDVPTIVHLAKDMFSGYDIYARTGYRESMAVPNRLAARQVVEDAIDRNQFLRLVTRLVHAHDVGIMGRRYQISRLREILKGVYELGFIFDSANDMFVEDSRVRKTRNWGVLEPGVEYTITFLRIDICGNTELVRTHRTDVIDATYEDLRKIVTEVCERRNGRVWLWEGDGGIVAFHLGSKHANAVLSAMEIVHSLYLYNPTRCRLDRPLLVRLAVHAGPCEYTDNPEELKKIETIREIFEIEKCTKPGTVHVSIVVRVMLDELIVSQLTPVDHRKNGHYRYELEIES